MPLVDVRLVRSPLASPAPDSGLTTLVDSTPLTADCGAECVFLGRTRAERHPQHGSLLRLEYEAYEAMALEVLHGLATCAVDRFGCRSIRLLHALGPVAVGQASVLVQVACGHRAEAFDACRFLIDELKIRAPIWKREVWADGTTWSDGRAVVGAVRRDVPALEEGSPIQ